MARLLIALPLLLTAGCSGCDTDGKTKPDSGTDTDTGSDADTDTDSDADSDTDTDSDSDTDSDTDTDPLLPSYCQIISPTSELAWGWTGRLAMHDDHMVWRYIDYGVSPTHYILMKRRLSTGIQAEVLHTTYPDTINRVALFGENAFFDRTTTTGQNIYRIGLSETTETQLTSNSYSEAQAVGGQNGVLYRFDDGTNRGLRYLEISTSNVTTIAEDSGLTVNETAFDGTRWIAYTEYVGATQEYLYKFDLNDTDAGPQQVESTNIAFAGLDFNKTTGELVGSIAISSVTDRGDIVGWNLETNERVTILSEPWDQLQTDTDGHVIGYLDSQAAGMQWFGNYLAEAKVVDRDTGVKRTVLPLDTYYGLGLWGHYLAVNNVGTWGDTIILCDMEAGGLMDTDGHVIPEGGYLDAGVDGGMDGGK